MALIKCPECGKEISDKSKQCIHCGFPIEIEQEKTNDKANANIRNIGGVDYDLTEVFECVKRYDKLSAIKILREITGLGLAEAKDMVETFIYDDSLVSSNSIKTEITINNQANSDTTTEKYENNTINETQEETVKRLKKDKISEILAMIGVVIWSILWSVICVWAWQESDDGSLGILIVVAFFCAAFGWIILLCSGSTIQQIEEDIQLASTDIEKYREIANKRIKDAAIKAKVMEANIKAEEKAKEILEHPQCPMCGSRNTQKISTMNRTISVGVAGLASSKIGKQYECRRCNHKW